MRLLLVYIEKPRILICNLIFLQFKSFFNHWLVYDFLQDLIDLGAVTILVPGSLPLGCNPALLTKFATINEEEYDQAGCLKLLNMFFEYHNELLQFELNRLRVLYPFTNIIYADYFNAALQFYKSPEQFGNLSSNPPSSVCYINVFVS